MNKVIVGSLAIVFAAISGCKSISASQPSTHRELSAQTLALEINNVPEEFSETYSRRLGFNRYTKVTAPNGKAIHLIAQDKLSDNQIIRARSVLEHYLMPYPGSEYGADKTAVANRMAENNAILLLLNGRDDGTNRAAELDGQPLYQDEIQVEGHQWYIEQNYDHRDATFEEILHLVHDTGIGVDQYESFMGVLPAYQAEIRNAQVSALAAGTWGIGSENQDWIEELRDENSLSQEYLASVVDSYYGLWGAWTDSKTYGMWGVYIAKTRDEIMSEDNLGAQLMRDKFFHPYLTYNARIDDSFSGDFSLRFDQNKPYTHHSQYLKDITLTGNNDVNVIVNQLDNHITGNSGKNSVIFTGDTSQYHISSNQDGKVVISDLVDGRDGVNTLSHVELAEFKDKIVSL
ncbi:hypothetical protein [Photobacterium proteolyticum]|uniref:hypothetical protein n=1 Tax=Photobacterium proteolyticum TaxID=1903952 RepID=UPI000AFD5B82|nr:hypothetical protein [Photobacterium proteolyticum]